MKLRRCCFLLPLFFALAILVSTTTPAQSQPDLQLFLPLIYQGSGGSAVRTWPDTTNGIFVYNDQTDLRGLTDAQIQFAATHYAGSQKQTRDEARRLRAYNPGYLVLHYRLGQALGHSVPSGQCQHSANMLSIIDGSQWIQEWPGNNTVQESWFYHTNGQREFNCAWGHYLMNLDDPGWRAWWSSQVIQQLQDNEDDGVFADSFSIPNYLGPWNPDIPVLDPTFEAAWAAKEHAFTDYIRGQFAGRWVWVPNIGSYITTRDPSDYSNVDGAMIEGFAEAGNGEYYAVGDWQLQMDRILKLVKADKILIGQTYPDPADVDERGFILGSYLLIKGKHTFINLETSAVPEWYPEFGINLGLPAGQLPDQISGLFNTSWGVYVRQYSLGMVLVNPGSSSRSIQLGSSYNRAISSGGGSVPANGHAAGTLSYQAVTSINLGPHQAAILFNK